MLRLLCLTAVLSCLGQPALAQSMLAWKLEKGNEFYVEEISDTNQKLAVLGQTSTQKAKQTLVFKVTVQDVNAETGAVTLEMKIEDLKSEGQGTGGADLFRRMEGAAFTLTLDKHAQVTKFAGYEEFVKRVAGENPRQEEIFRSMLGEETLRSTLTRIFDLIPGREGKPQETWEKPLDLPLGPFGSLALTRRYTLAEVKSVNSNDIARLTIDGSAVYKASETSYETLPFRVLEGELKTDKLAGTASFNVTTGRLQTLEFTTDLQGAIQVRVGSQTEKITLNRKSTVTVNVTPTKPVVR